MFLIPVLITYISADNAANFVEICNIYANQLLIKVAIGIVNSDKLCRSYDDFGVTFGDTGLYTKHKN